MPRTSALPLPVDSLDAPVRALAGVSSAREKVLGEAGIRTVFDLLVHLPFRYENRARFRSIRELRPGAPATVAATVAAVLSKPNWYRKVPLHEVLVDDGTGKLAVVWFGQRWLAKSIVPGVRLALHGAVVGDGRGTPRFENPQFEVLPDDAAEDDGIHVGRIVPIHERIAPPGASRPIAGKLLRRLLWTAVHAIPADLADPLPAGLLAEKGWPGRGKALAEVHFPGISGGAIPGDDELDAPRSAARERLAFEELLAFQLRVEGERRRRLREERAPAIAADGGARARLEGALPFRLTAAQRRAVDELAADLASGRPMARLLQGDVGSGKSAVAFLALALVAESGLQGAIMAPTEILAEQLGAGFARLLGSAAPRHAVLTGAVRGAPRREILEGLASGEIRVLVGTHALLEEPVEIPRLALAVVDEQHRFGVAHRERLRAKGGEGTTPHLLVMTATPIPRSLALTVYGDLDVTRIDELPPGRQPVSTHVREGGAREKVFRFVAERVSAGERAYVVFPFVEESERLVDVRALLRHAEEVRALLPGIATALVHGRMKPAERSAEMARFAGGEASVLLATTVIEVGVDVPEATVIVVENAERFGLAQLHQLRGRVGRSERPSWCVLLAGDGAGPDAMRRLGELSRLSSGFDVAEADLRFRGPGEVFGRRQSGLAGFRVADPLARLDLVLEAREAARRAAEDGGDAEARRQLAGWRMEEPELPRG